MMLWIYARHPTRTTDIKFNPIDHFDMKIKLSPYTIASNCTDLTDIRDGINEIHEDMKRLVSEGKNVPSFFYSRLSKLQAKRKKFEQKNQIHMNVTIRFFIDEETLTMAVRHCLHFQIEPSFPNVKKVIRNAVLNNGKSIIDFPESWGDDLMDVNQVEVDKALQLLKPSFGL
jgi:hypothetical protein